MMIQVQLGLDELQCQPMVDKALALGSPGCWPSDFSRAGAPVHVLRLENVLYVPELEIQVVDGKTVPLEAVRHSFYVGFEQGRWREQGRGPVLSTTAVVRDDDVCVLSTVFTRAFGEWMQELFKVVVLERAGFTGKYVISDLPAFAAASLALMGISQDRIDGTVVSPTIFRHAWFTTNIHHQNVHEYPAVYFAFREVFLSVDISSEPVFPERLWLDRGTQAVNGRELINRDEIVALVRRYGFVDVDMATLSLRQQVAAARGMTVLAGPHGSQFVHAMFMPQRSTVIECFSPFHLNPSILEICYVMRHRYFQVVPVNTAYAPYEWDKALHLLPLHLELVLRSID